MNDKCPYKTAYKTLTEFKELVQQTPSSKRLVLRCFLPEKRISFFNGTHYDYSVGDDTVKFIQPFISYSGKSSDSLTIMMEVDVKKLVRHIKIESVLK